MEHGECRDPFAKGHVGADYTEDGSYGLRSNHDGLDPGKYSCSFDFISLFVEVC